MTELTRILFTLCLAILVFWLAGCSTYKYARQKDSAYVRGVDDTKLKAYLSFRRPLSIDLVDIDGSRIGFLESGDSGRYISPGRHSILIECTDPAYYHMVAGDDGIDQGVIDPVEDRVAADFQANHAYQFTMESGFHITLWDDTNGEDKRVGVAHWDFSPDDFRHDEPVKSVEELAGEGLTRHPAKSDEK